MAIHFLSDSNGGEGRGLALIAGESGAGKTYFAHALAADPQYAPVLSLSFDKSFNSIWPRQKYAKMLAAEFNGEVPDIQLDVVPIDDIATLADILNGLASRTLRYKPTGQPFKTVVLDNITRMQQKHLLQLKGETIIGFEPERPDYGKSQNAIIALLTLIQDKCPVEFLATCEIRGEKPTKRVQMEADGLTPQMGLDGQPILDKADPESTIGYRLGLSSTVGSMVPGFFAITGRLYIGPRRVRIFDARPNLYFRIAKDSPGAVVGVRPPILSRDAKPKRVEGVLFNGTMLDIVDQLREQNSEQATIESNVS